jgi:hypothetical protein
MLIGFGFGSGCVVKRAVVTRMRKVVVVVYSKIVLPDRPSFVQVHSF